MQYWYASTLFLFLRIDQIKTKIIHVTITIWTIPKIKSKDFIDEILNLDSSSLDEALKFEKLLADDSILIKQEPEELSMAEVRDRQKKDNHNMSEYATRTLEPLFSDL